MNRKFEFAGIIPSVNETKFEDAIVEDETFGIVTTFDEWKEWKVGMINDRYSSGYNPDFGTLNTSFIDDIEGVKYLSEQMNLGGFMLAPTALLNGKLITAKTQAFVASRSLHDFRSKYAVMSEKLYLYDVIFYPALPKYEMINPMPHACDPYVNAAEAHWKIRFGMVE